VTAEKINKGKKKEITGKLIGGGSEGKKGGFRNLFQSRRKKVLGGKKRGKKGGKLKNRNRKPGKTLWISWGISGWGFSRAVSGEGVVGSGENFFEGGSGLYSFSVHLRPSGRPSTVLAKASESKEEGGGGASPKERSPFPACQRLAGLGKDRSAFEEGSGCCCSVW